MIVETTTGMIRTFLWPLANSLAIVAMILLVMFTLRSLIREIRFKLEKLDGALRSLYSALQMVQRYVQLGEDKKGESRNELKEQIGGVVEDRVEKGILKAATAAAQSVDGVGPILIPIVPPAVVEIRKPEDDHKPE